MSTIFDLGKSSLNELFGVKLLRLSKKYLNTSIAGGGNLLMTSKEGGQMFRSVGESDRLSDLTCPDLVCGA
jgi:hypothetical protein